MRYGRYQDRHDYDSNRGGFEDREWGRQQGGWGSPEQESGRHQSRQEGYSASRGASFGPTRYSPEDRGFSYGESGRYREHENQPYPRGGYNQQGQQPYGSHAQDDYRREQYGMEGVREPKYGGSQRGDESGAGWPQGQAYERGRYSREQSDYPEQRYGSGTMAGGSGYGGPDSRPEHGYGAGGSGMRGGYAGAGYGQSPMGEYTSYGNRGNRNPDNRGPKGYSRSDDRIKDEVCECFMRAQSFDPGEIEVEVKNGEVTLSGEVDDREDKFNAERTAHSVMGVKDVNNNLRCGSRTGSSSERSDTQSFGSRSGGGSSSSSSNDSKQRTGSNAVGASR
jgi:osmotically-inducible protein OsmY